MAGGRISGRIGEKYSTKLPAVSRNSGQNIVLLLLSPHGGRKKNYFRKRGSCRTLLRPRNGFLLCIKLGFCHANPTPQQAASDNSFFVGICRVFVTRRKLEIRHATQKKGENTAFAQRASYPQSANRFQKNNKRTVFTIESSTITKNLQMISLFAK